MKKVLFATTALVATAGVAAADVTLSGSAVMGIIGGDTVNAATAGITQRDTQFATDIDVTFTMSGTTDNGLTFGASIDLDESDGSAGTVVNEATNGVDLNGDGDTTDRVRVNANGRSDAFERETQGGETIFISGNFGTLTMGDTDGALDWAMTELPTGTIDDVQEGLGWNGNSGLDGRFDGQILRYDNTIGSFGVALSLELDDTANTTAAPNQNRGEVLGVGIKYTANLGGTDLNFGLGYQTAERTATVDEEVIGLSLGTSMGGIDLVFNYSEFSRDGELNDIVHIGLGGTYEIDAWTFGILYGQYDDGIRIGGAVGGGGAGAFFSNGHENNNLAFTAKYDLGGGASAHFGYNRSEATVGTQAGAALGVPVGTTNSANQFSLGLAMSF